MASAVPCSGPMPRKHPRPDADVDRLAAQLRGRWVPANGIEPWLRRNVARLRRMVRDEGWSWADIGRAMTLAGITYGGGRPWTGRLLTVKVAQVREQLRRREAARTAHERLAPASPGGVRSAVSLSRPGRSEHREPAMPAGEPEFRVARLPAGVVLPSAVTPSAPTVSVQHRRDPDAVIAELLARPKLGAVPMPSIPEPEEDV
jgi:hypothetical protein